MSDTRTVVDDLAELVEGHAREATEQDQIGGTPARVVAAPGSSEQASALLAAAARHGLRVGARGRGTAMHWGAPPRSLDLLVDTHRLDQIVEHVAGDLVCIAQAGTTLDAVNERVRAHGQQLALDQPYPGASIGGTLSTARSGHRRLQYGAPRDLVLGVTLVRADGVIARAGGKVVKNVAGYDLAKLVTGAYGTLGLLTQATFRLHPLPAARRWLTLTCPDPASAAAHALALAGSQLAPTAVEVQREAGSSSTRVSVLLEGTARGVDERTVLALRQLGEQAGEAADGDQPGALPAARDGVLIKLAVPLTRVGALLAAAIDAEDHHGVPVRVAGSAGVGVLYAGCPGVGDPDALAATVRDLRAACAGGSAVVLHAPAAVRERVDAWGPVPGLDLMRRVKDQFDPEHRLAPGRFVGGI